MMFKTKLATLVGALTLATSAFAAHQAPEACPSVSAIQNEGLSMSIEVMQDMYLAYNLSRYNTESNWVFVIGIINAESDDEALDEGNENLSTLTGAPTPEEEDGSYICEYDTGSQDLAAFAIQADDMVSPLKMTHYFKKGH